VQLDSPAGTRVALLSRVGGSGDDFDDTSFDDAAAQDITSGSAPFKGSFKPREPLAQLIDEVAAGDWTLNVRDQAAGAEGVLQSWTLRIGGQTFQSASPARTIPDNGTLRSSIAVGDPVRPLVPGTGEASGIGGDVKIQAGTVSVQNGADVSAVTRGAGKGGTVTLNTTGALALSNGRIATDTLASGAAGDIAIDAAQVALQGPGAAILAGASAGSSGITGNLTVKAAGAIDLSNHAILSIRNDATAGSGGKPQPSLLLVDAHTIVLSDAASITAAATGDLNASDIQILFRGRLIVDPSSITTSAEDGNGGDIDIRGSGLLWLDHSEISTSAEHSGNGGDIRISADILLMETGFIQANTGAPRAQGGDVSINAGTLLSSGPLLVGGETPFAFDATLEGINVIQAAAPDGVSGNVTLSTPALDIAGDLSALPTEIADPAPLTRDLCRLGAGSSLTPIGRGGLRPTAVGMIRPERALAASGEDASSAAVEAGEQATPTRRMQPTSLVNGWDELGAWLTACVPMK
jgi:large exoprotein involved in heme utilization and adhesion